MQHQLSEDEDVSANYFRICRHHKPNDTCCHGRKDTEKHKQPASQEKHTSKLRSKLRERREKVRSKRHRLRAYTEIDRPLESSQRLVRKSRESLHKLLTKESSRSSRSSQNQPPTPRTPGAIPPKQWQPVQTKSSLKLSKQLSSPVSQTRSPSLSPLPVPTRTSRSTSNASSNSPHSPFSTRRPTYSGSLFSNEPSPRLFSPRRSSASDGFQLPWFTMI